MDHSPITASTRMAATPGEVFGFLDDLANHVMLAPRSAHVVSLGSGPHGLGHAVVRLTGPLRLRRTASTEIVRTEEPGLIAGRATIGARTRAAVTWRISSVPEGSLVSLCATIEAVGPLDSLVLRAGGRRWIARRFAAALKTLAWQLEAPAGATQPVVSQMSPAPETAS
jgi:Polyketide cyclase / dehydrase and lipid transport